MVARSRPNRSHATDAAHSPVRGQNAATRPPLPTTHERRETPRRSSYMGNTAWLLTGRRPFGGRRRQDALVHENRARDGRDVRVRLSRAPATTGEGRPTQRVALGGAEVHRARGRRGGARDAGRVLHRVGKVRLFGRYQVAQVRLHGGDVRLRLGVRELRDRDRGQDADDHDHDQELNERETLAVHLYYPLSNLWKQPICHTYRSGSRAGSMPARTVSLPRYFSAH